MDREHVEDLILAGQAYAELNERLKESEREALAAVKMIAAMLKVVGGEMIIPHNVLVAMDYNVSVSRWEDPLTDSIVLTLKEH